MRANAPFMAALALSGLALFAPAANATTHRAPVKSASAPAPKISPTKASARSKPSAKKSEARKTVAKKTDVKAAKSAHGKPVVEKTTAHTAARGKRAKPLLREVSRKRPEPAKPAAKAPTHVARLESPALKSAPEPVEEAAPAGPEPHVNHNRKAHLDAETAAPAAVPDTTPSGLTTGVSHPPSDDEAAPRKANAATTDGAPMASVVFLNKPTAELAPAELAVSPDPMPELYNKRGRLIMPPPLKGSHEILVRQNVNADRDGLVRIQDDADLMHMREAKSLVALPVSASLEVDERLPVNRRFARPWTAKFLADMARVHYARFHTPLQVNSAVRTVEFQVKLIRTNGNAAPAEGDTASPHLTGQAVDIAKKGLSLTEIAWMRGYLLPLVQQGKVDVEEEFQQSCFHISVYRKYVPQTAPPRIVATHRGSVDSLASAMQ